MSASNDPRSAVAHLYRRAGFGATPAQLDAAAAAGFGATVDELLRAAPDPAADAAIRPALGPIPYAQLETIEERKARALARRTQHQALLTWWVERMTLAERPLVEKMTLFWHAHFATSIAKVNQPTLMFTQNETMRALGLGSFETLAQAIAKDPAMMLWLDSNQNRKGAPNENFSRELMELFTIGIGNYTDADVREGARAFTGWRTNRDTGVFSVAAAQNDRGVKTVLGKTVVTGEEVVAVLAASPAAARFVSAKLWSRFAAPTTPNSAVAGDLGAVFQASGGNVGEVMRALFRHPEFLSTSTRQGLVKQPIEFVVSALRVAGLRPTNLDVTGPSLTATFNALNQVPFAPPSVGGWPQNGYWISTATALSRLRFAQQLSGVAPLDWLSGTASAARVDALAARFAIDGWTRSTANALRLAPAPRQQFALAIASPEFALN